MACGEPQVSGCGNRACFCTGQCRRPYEYELWRYPCTPAPIPQTTTPDPTIHKMHGEGALKLPNDYKNLRDQISDLHDDVEALTKLVKQLIEKRERITPNANL